MESSPGDNQNSVSTTGSSPDLPPPPPQAYSSSEEYETPRDSMSVVSVEVRDDHPKLTVRSRTSVSNPPDSPGSAGGGEGGSENPSLESMDGGSRSSLSRDNEEALATGETVTAVSPFRDSQIDVGPDGGTASIPTPAEVVTSAVRKLRIGHNPSMLAKSLSGITKEEVICSDGQESPMEDRSWSAREKHFFIFSNSGKPIYSRYGDEAGLAGLMAIMQAMLSIVNSQSDTARALLWGGSKVVFRARGPLVLVAMSRAEECTTWIQRQLEYLYNQLLSLTTGAILQLLERNPAQDVRNLLKGSGNLMAGLIDGFSYDPGYSIEAHCPLRMMPEVRTATSDALHTAVKECHAKCGMLLCGGCLVSLIQDPWSPTHIQDMLLLQNFVLSNPLYREQAGVEFNAPICMPHLHQTAFLHAYIYYLEPGSPGIVVVLLMTQPDSFHVASSARRKMEETLHNSGVLHTLRGLQSLSPLDGQIQHSELPLAAGGGKQEASPIIYFVFRLSSKLCPQYVSLQLPAKESRASRKRLLRTVARAHSTMSGGLHGSPGCQTLWCMDSNCAMLAIQESQYDLYLLCDTLTPKGAALKIGRELARYLSGQQMREELFVSQKLSS